jgi:hypothetical protein
MRDPTNPHLIQPIVRDMAQWILIAEQNDRMGVRGDYVHSEILATWAERLMFAGPDNGRELEWREDAIRMAMFLHRQLTKRGVVWPTT